MTTTKPSPDAVEALVNIIAVIKSGGAISSSIDKVGFAFKLHEALSTAEVAVTRAKAPTKDEVETLSPENLMKSLNKISRTLTSNNIVSYTHLAAAIAELASRRANPAASTSSDIEFALNKLAYFCGENSGAELDFISAIRAHISAIVTENKRLCDALKGVIRVADRKTVEFDEAKAAIAQAESQPK